MACVQGNDELVELILKYCSKLINIPDKHGFTPAHYAAQGWPDILNLLLKQDDIDLEKTTVDFCDKQSGVPVSMCGGLTPILLAAENGCDKCLKII
eukprot:UN05592